MPSSSILRIAMPVKPWLRLTLANRTSETRPKNSARLQPLIPTRPKPGSSSVTNISTCLRVWHFGEPVYTASRLGGTVFLVIFCFSATVGRMRRSEEHTSELQSRLHLVCRLLLEKKTKHAVRPPPVRLYDLLQHR